MSDNIRTVWESPRFTTERNRLNPNIERMDEILDGVTWLLAIRPELGQRTSNPKVWAVVTAEWGTESFVVYYSFTETTVILEAIRKSIQTNDN